MKYFVGACLVVLIFQSCKNSANSESDDMTLVDSIELNIENIVNDIIANKDSLAVVPSMRFAKGEDETYTAKMYGKNQETKLIREEQISNTVIVGRDYYYNNSELIFLKEEGSVFENAVEVYTEKLFYFQEGELYKAYSKNQFTEDNMFDDSLFEVTNFDVNQIDFEKPARALQQKGEFEMFFDQFLLIDPQSYLIVENSDKTINAALYIIEGDSVLNRLYENPDTFKGAKLWVYHSFREMNGIERMIYEGAVFQSQ
ncbi:MAG: hypothetical protein AB8B72_13055 [Crocinitomicaceae bacterium]